MWYCHRLVQVFFCLIAISFTSVLPLIASFMLLPQMIVCDKTLPSFLKLFFLKWVLFFLFLSAEMIPGKYKYSNIWSVSCSYLQFTTLSNIEKRVTGKITEGPSLYKISYFSDFVRVLYNSCLLDLVLKSIWIQPHL